MGFVYAPFMNIWFGSAPLELRHWLVPLCIGLAVFFVVEAEKAIFRGIGQGSKRKDRTSADRAFELESAIAKRAYTLWEQAGRPDGRDKKFWTRAEAEINAEAKRSRGGKR